VYMPHAPCIEILLFSLTARRTDVLPVVVYKLTSLEFAASARQRTSEQFDGLYCIAIGAHALHTLVMKHPGSERGCRIAGHPSPSATAFFLRTPTVTLLRFLASSLCRPARAR